MTGVRTDHGDLPADLVIDATARRSPVDEWLTQIGARATATWRAECGIAYFSRHYRVRPGARLPAPLVTRIVVALDEFLAGKWGGDNGAVQLVVAPLAADRRFRTAKDPQVFTAVLRTVPVYAAWLEVMDPITDVFPMAGLHNTLRRLVAGGTPVATGLHAIGDSVCTTNPTLGRGLALALAGAADLADTIADPAAQALALDRLVGAYVAPFYHDQAAIDAGRLAMMRHTIFGAPPPPPAQAPGRVTYSQLRAAASWDPAAFRAFWTINGMVCPPDEVYTDPDVVASTQENAPAARHRAAGHPAHPRAAPHRPHPVEACILARPPNRMATMARWLALTRTDYAAYREAPTLPDAERRLGAADAGVSEAGGRAQISSSRAECRCFCPCDAVARSWPGPAGPVRSWGGIFPVAVPRGGRLRRSGPARIRR